MLSENELREIVRRVVEDHLTTAAPPPPTPPSASAATATPAFGTGPRPKSLALGADHGGYELKEKLKPLLYDLGWTIEDVGTFSEAAVDYPEVALRVALPVSQGKVARGIMIDGAGIGSAMAANKVPGVRAALCYDTMTARNSREHNDANVLTLGGRLIGIALAQEIVRVWLATECREERHQKRVAMIDDIQRRFSGAAAGAR